MRSLLVIAFLLALVLPAARPDDAPGAAGAAAPAAADADRARYEEAAAYSEARGGTSLLVERGGRVVYERYAPGWTAARPHALASGTKSFWGVAVAAAVEDGLFGWDDRVSDVLTEWKDDPMRSRITVRHLLSLTSGLRRTGFALQNPFTADRFAYAVGIPADVEQGSAFRYDSGPYFAFGAFFRRKTGKDPVGWLTERVLRPIGMDVPFWNRDRAGNPAMPFGASVTPREWAKFGEFVKQGGAWSGKQIVRKESLEALFAGSAANPAYGLTWWLPGRGGVDPAGRPLPKATRADAPKDVWMAAGLGQQLLVVCPSLDLVVVRQGWAGRSWDNEYFLGLVLGGSGPSSRAEAFLKRYDLDGDGSLSRTEVPEPLGAAFARLDADGDGRLSLAEIAAGLGR
jgi:CubicO group peptidase (beta-lactamase class C family)